MYASAPTLDAQRVTDIVEAEPIPIALHGGSGMTDEQFTDLIGRGCAKVNISTALKVTYMKSNLEFLEEAEAEGQVGPAVAVHRTCARPCMEMAATTSAGSAARARPGDRR